ncbi:MAG: ATP--guanido phosphotransferase, partial [Kiritimatiellaeota bacterium]|nr:ATP--guanido phosphotransferase [Kiritimatiellota bacterium]
MTNSILFSCRARIARNVADTRFPDFASEDERHAVREKICAALAASPPFDHGSVHRIEEIPAATLLCHIEDRHISQDLTQRGNGGAWITDASGQASVMVNEEDHLRIQVVRPDADIRKAWAKASELERAIEGRLTYAFHDTYGYLTACPSNVGTGLRVSVMMRLLGLTLTNETEQAFKALDALGFAVRGLWGEGTEGSGHLFQISNQQTLGEREEDIVTRLESIIAATAEQERNARLRIMERKPLHLLDAVCRSIATLQNARILQSSELLDFLSVLSLGLEFGLVGNVT